jgi:two-component sensor histidine kinase
MSRDATIREIHHRVKNNLQTVAALLRLQSRRSTSDETRLALAEAHARVAAIAVVHEALSTDTAEQVDLGVVLESLAALMRDLAPAFEDPPDITVECGPISLPGEVATPLAMCVTEVLANALEHASASAVHVSAAAEGRYVSVRVADDGVGMPADEADVGLGISIVRALAETELRGEVSWISNHGTTVVIRADVRPRQGRSSAEGVSERP